MSSLDYLRSHGGPPKPTNETVVAMTAWRIKLAAWLATQPMNQSTQGLRRSYLGVEDREVHFDPPVEYELGQAYEELSDAAARGDI